MICMSKCLCLTVSSKQYDRRDKCGCCLTVAGIVCHWRLRPLVRRTKIRPEVQGNHVKVVIIELEVSIDCKHYPRKHSSATNLRKLLYWWWGGGVWHSLHNGQQELNGMEWNGMEWNGMEWNGMEWNGMEWNGMEWNGMVYLSSLRYTDNTIE
jgi:hypothetical protein